MSEQGNGAGIVSVQMPSTLTAELDRIAARYYTSRSAVIKRACHELSAREKAVAAEAVAQNAELATAR